MTATATAAAIPRITHDRATEVGHAASDQLLDLLARLDEAQWAAPTDCDGWDVAAMVGHMIGAAEGHLSLRESFRQLRHGMRHADAHGGNGLDATNALQVAEHAHLSPAARLARLREIARPAVEARTAVNGVLRRAPIPLDIGKGSMPAGLPRTITYGHLMDVIYTRDVWLHTVDIERATGVAADRSGTVDTAVVHDCVAEWLDRHGRPVRLHLTGPGGGTFAQGTGGPRHELPAIEWARTVSGRAPADGLLAFPLLF